MNVTALVTLNRSELDERIGPIPQSLMHEVDRGLRQVLGW